MMTLRGNEKPETERSQALAWSLTTVGGALFLLGFLRLLTGYTAAADPAPALLSLRLAGWFAVSGWVIPYFPLLGNWGRNGFAAVRTWFRGPGDGILEVLLCGLFFIVLLLVGMVSLWVPTIR